MNRTDISILMNYYLLQYRENRNLNDLGKQIERLRKDSGRDIIVEYDPKIDNYRWRLGEEINEQD